MSWEPCPRCGSKKVVTIGKSMFFILGICLIGLFWLGFIFPPLFALPVVGVVLLVLAPFAPKTNQCKECKYSWQVKKAKVK